MKYPLEWSIGAIYQPLGTMFGFVLAKLCRLEPADARAVSLETGVQARPPAGRRHHPPPPHPPHSLPLLRCRTSPSCSRS